MRQLISTMLLAAATPVGAQWVAQDAHTTAEFRGLAAVSSRVVWASGTRGRVARTTDGGKTWVIDTIPGASALDLRAIAARSATVAWAQAAGLADSGQAKIF